MTNEINRTQIISSTQQKNKMPDHKFLSASAPLSSSRESMPGDHNQSAFQPTAYQPALRQCIYIALQCSRCGYVRQAITDLPAQAVVACPECSKECAFVFLGSGMTSRPIPFHQVYIAEPTRWDSHADGETNSS